MKGAKHILMLIVSIFLWLFVAITAFLLFLIDFVVWLLTFWWDRRLKLLHKYSSVWAMFYIWINPGWRIKVSGLEKIDKSKSYVIVCNHQSAFDIVLLYRLFTHFKWVAKKELAKVPVIGWNLILNNSILIDRASAVSTKKMISQGLKHLKGGSSVLIFPEGTRTKDGQVKRFKEGAFLLAKQANSPILPVVIEGSKDIFPKPGIVKLRQNLTLKVLDPVEVEEVLSTSVPDLTKRLNQLIMEEHKKLAPEKYMNSDNKQVK
ncbi:lysophospholipid acyltransferase family protein [Tenuifilum sp.]|uniref:lysophospholipid acyltransferase family protein n=1 Tax=Tenuifilum sp. TaxID=2760880 RepID=UPI002CE9F945|nr:1-acylglycerol-3-phosphate O-acyltransferase [Tenuifilum sp.]